MKRSERATLARETLEILQHGAYTNRDGQNVDLTASLRACLDGTCLYRPSDFDALLSEVQTLLAQRREHTYLEVTEETTLEAAARLHKSGRVLCLNFASAKNPGGGFLSGSQAQEESLARSSALYLSAITQNEYYDRNRESESGLYTDHLIYSPQVPVIRDDAGNLLSEPYCADMLTAPAVNAGAVRQNHPQLSDQIRSTMESRLEKVLAVAVKHGAPSLVLGAWGSGVFQNDPEEVADMFHAALTGRFANAFKHVVFAIYDRSAERGVWHAFQRRFGV
jgi:uncharacterized protein (TIGR02452 family)